MSRGRLKNPDGSTRRDLGELQIELECPCGRTVAIFDRGVLHGMPMCQDFEERRPEHYVAWLRGKLEAT